MTPDERVVKAEDHCTHVNQACRPAITCRICAQAAIREAEAEATRVAQENDQSFGDGRITGIREERKRCLAIMRVRVCSGELREIIDGIANEIEDVT